MKLFALAAILIAIAGGIGMLTLGSLHHVLLVHLFTRLVLLPLALVMVIWLIVGLVRTGAISARLKKTFLVSLLISGAMHLSLHAGGLASDYHVCQAQEFVAQVLPMLDEYKAKDGMYPGSLDDPRLGVPPLPRLLSPFTSYASTGDKFRFSFSVPAEWRDHIFDSESRSWDYKK